MSLRRAIRPLARLLVEPEWRSQVLDGPPIGFPDFLGIGVPKAGTTWLHENLRVHPELFLPSTKELHFFDQAWHKPVRSYLDHFKVSEAAGTKTGEITPSYCTLGTNRIRWVQRLNPNIKLLLMLRNPAEQAWSYIMMKDYWDTDRPSKPLDIPPQELLERVKDRALRARTQHAAIARRWLSIFPRNQIFVGLYEGIESEPMDLLAGVFSFLGVSEPTDWSPFPLATFFNKSRGPGLPSRLRQLLSAHYEGSVLETQEVLGVDLRHWLT